jgi:hypothetical protein
MSVQKVGAWLVDDRKQIIKFYHALNIVPTAITKKDIITKIATLVERYYELSV